jgi:hypothetical protein
MNKWVGVLKSSPVAENGTTMIRFLFFREAEPTIRRLSTPFILRMADPSRSVLIYFRNSLLGIVEEVNGLKTLVVRVKNQYVCCVVADQEQLAIVKID